MSGSALDTPEDVIRFALGGRLSKHALASLLTAAARKPFSEACARIELNYTKDCALNDTCLEAGCSVDGERCLQPLLRAGTDYEKACGTEWVKLFADDANRDQSWKMMALSFELG